MNEKARILPLTCCLDGHSNGTALVAYPFAPTLCALSSICVQSGQRCYRSAFTYIRLKTDGSLCKTYRRRSSVPKNGQRARSGACKCS
jgi:hypothetical protein